MNDYKEIQEIIFEEFRKYNEEHIKNLPEYLRIKVFEALRSKNIINDDEKMEKYFSDNMILNFLKFYYKV